MVNVHPLNQYLLYISALQNGKYPRGKGSSLTRRVDDQNIILYQGRILYYTHIPGSHKVPQIFMSEPDVRVQLPSVWPFHSTESFTKLLHPVVGFLRLSRIQYVIYLDNIILIIQQEKSKLLEQTYTVLDLLEALGFLVNYTIIPIEATPHNQIFGIRSGFSKERVETPTGEGHSDQARSQHTLIERVCNGQ